MTFLPVHGRRGVVYRLGQCDEHQVHIICMSLIMLHSENLFSVHLDTCVYMGSLCSASGSCLGPGTVLSALGIGMNRCSLSLTLPLSLGFSNGIQTIKNFNGSA